MSAIVKQVSGRAGLREFIKFPFGLYKNVSCWVPPLISGELKTLDPRLNPAQKTAPVALFIAERDGKQVGRIAAIAHHSESGVEGRFGWYDVIDDLGVSRSLFEVAERWLRDQGATQVKGPMGFTNLDKAGMLTFGFDELPTISTIYNFKYYNDHMTFLGYEKSRDYLEFEFTVPDSIPDKVTAFADVIARRYGLKVLTGLSSSEVLKYGHQLFTLINETHRNLYGFKLLSEEMKEYYIKRYLPFIKPDFVALIVNEHDLLVAYALTMPSFSRAFQKARGKIYPFGIWHIYRAYHHIRRADLLLIGVTDSLRNKGVTSLIFHKLLNTFIKYNIQRIESNPELEDNQQVQALWHKYEYRQHKRRRIYQRDI